MDNKKEIKKAKKLLTTKETALFLGLHENTVRNLVKSGKLKMKKFGNGKTSAVRFQEEDIQEFLNNQ